VRDDDAPACRRIIDRIAAARGRVVHQAVAVELEALKPAAGEGRGVAVGLVLSLLLHPLALVLVVIVGSWIDPREGALLFVPFLALIGLTEWIYLGPAAWLLRRRGSVAMAKGVVIGGGLVTLASTLGYGGMGLLSL
jgi:hypothetical protein